MNRIVLLCCLLAAVPCALAQRQMENLTRGVVAVTHDEGVYVGWRLLGTEPEEIAFNVYRRSDDAEPVRVNVEPITGATNVIDSDADTIKALDYFVKPVLDGKELAPSRAVRAWDKPYLEIPIQPIPDYRPGDASIADLDGDGEYEIVLHQSSRARDNSHAGITGTPIFDAYELDGTHLWRIDLGKNIRDGQHYTQFMVYDLDGDGRAEMACKTADGTTDGVGNVIGDASKDYRVLDEDDKRFGRVLDGPEFFTIFDGKTGAVLKTVDYIPNRYPIDGWGGKGGNGGNDSYGNRCDRFLACVAYLDGERPSVVMCRGVYGRTVMAAWDWRDGKLTNRWTFDSKSSYPPYEDASPFSGMGGHSLSVADVDADGRDEIVYQAMVVDDNGEGLYSTGRRHGDSMHIGDFYPDRPGLETFLITENEGRTVTFQTPGAGMHDARTGEVIWSHSHGIDVKAGLVADIDPRYPGAEAWGGPGGLRDAKGKDIGPCPRSTGFAVWWDGDLLRELLGRGSTVTKWNWETGNEETLFRMSENDGRRRWGRRPCLVGDLLGDWREEILLPSPDGKSLRLFTTTIPTKHRIRTLMHDSQYRLGIAWQNVVYNKPAHPSFFLGHQSLKIGDAQSIGENGTMVVCHSPEANDKPMDVLIHFHGATSVAADNFAKSELSGALAVINFKGLSAAYSKPFHDDSQLFDALLKRIREQLGMELKWGRVSVSSFSAGYGAVREILKTPKSFNRIDALLAADSMYASLEQRIDQRRPIEEHMRDYIRFAQLASEGKKTFVIIHTNQETSYASTTETADHLLEALRINRESMSRHDAEPLVLKSKAVKGKFTVLGYAGTTGEDHMQHLRNIHLWWRKLSNP